MDEIRVARQAEVDTETAAFIRALRLVAARNDGALTPDRYSATRATLKIEGVEIPSFPSVVRHFSTWTLAKESIGLSDVTTAKKIEARFRGRVSHRRPYFDDAELLDAIQRCGAFYGRAPLLAEYDEWRLREMALMRARGEWPRVPSTSAIRRRHQSWEEALRTAGYSPEAIYVRLEAPERRSRLAKVDRYTDETLRQTLLRCGGELGHPPLVTEYVAWREEQIKRSRKRRLSIPSNGPFRSRWGSWRKALLACGFDEKEVDARVAAARERTNRNLDWPRSDGR
ncbi:MAG TPA: hypothetical protein VKR79_07550 [Gaiellaceae bacterium]|nr:hypothetical protein [Gaiellaceae bacterium]